MHFLCAFIQIAQCIRRCSFNLFLDSPSIASTSGPLTFYAVLTAPKIGILDALSDADSVLPQQVQLEVYLLVRPKLYHQAHFKHIYDCSVCTLLYISKRTKKFTLTFILHPFTHLTVFWGIILKGVPYTLSFAIPVAFGLSYL